MPGNATITSEVSRNATPTFSTIQRGPGCSGPTLAGRGPPGARMRVGARPGCPPANPARKPGCPAVATAGWPHAQITHLGPRRHGSEGARRVPAPRGEHARRLRAAPTREFRNLPPIVAPYAINGVVGVAGRVRSGGNCCRTRPRWRGTRRPGVRARHGGAVREVSAHARACIARHEALVPAARRSARMSIRSSA